MYILITFSLLHTERERYIYLYVCIYIYVCLYIFDIFGYSTQKMVAGANGKLTLWPFCFHRIATHSFKAQLRDLRGVSLRPYMFSNNLGFFGGGWIRSTTLGSVRLPHVTVDADSVQENQRGTGGLCCLDGREVPFLVNITIVYYLLGNILYSYFMYLFI